MAFGGGTDEEQKMRALLGQRLSAYVPEAVLRWHAEAVDAHASERAYEPGNSERFEAAVGFFDISGFSKLSHALHLKERAEMGDIVPGKGRFPTPVFAVDKAGTPLGRLFPSGTS